MKPFTPHFTTRRQLLTRTGMGFTGLVLGSMLHAEESRASAPWAPPDGKPHFAPKAKSVIWIFLQGGVSHLESFDPKPELTKYGGKTISETPHKGVLDSPFVKKNVVQFTAAERKLMMQVLPLQVGFQKRGQSGIEISDWWPHVGGVVDDLAIVRSVWTTDNDHAAQLQFHTGRHIFQGFHPSIGSWIHYGLGSMNENIPKFVVLGPPVPAHLGGAGVSGGNYLGPQHSGVHLSSDPANPLPYASPATKVSEREQRSEFEFIADLNELDAARYPADPAIRARIKSYELAFRMQTAVPEVLKLTEEPTHVKKLYGLEQENTKHFGQDLLTARRLVERGVRFVQVFHGYRTDGNGWDAHSELKKNHGKLSGEVDLPLAGLIADLKQRGLLKDTLVVWGTEFGRTPGVEGNRDGRDHHPFGFSCWLAGGGLKGGIAHGATDELGFHAVENRHYVTDLHATAMHQLGLDPRRLEVPGHKRLDIDFGEPIREIIA